MKNRTFGDWLFDNFMWVVGGTFLLSFIGIFVLLSMLASHSHEIARELGGIARSAADGYSQGK